VVHPPVTAGRFSGVAVRASAVRGPHRRRVAAL